MFSASSVSLSLRRLKGAPSSSRLRRLLMNERLPRIRVQCGQNAAEQRPSGLFVEIFPCFKGRRKIASLYKFYFVPTLHAGLGQCEVTLVQVVKTSCLALARCQNNNESLLALSAVLESAAKSGLSLPKIRKLRLINSSFSASIWLISADFVLVYYHPGCLRHSITLSPGNSSLAKIRVSTFM
ncbi:hypothetical protein TcasGA2_TC008269 [Tribolium castaneum]|uniref:Uncharacterized protein n=1 Tax=Tribolium castaneum TaxID=7070 RepID=D2A0U3_TRICA|nr:hypothetical protein TcasGA2_TC008269 [Tribolium castaneum]